VPKGGRADGVDRVVSLLTQLNNSVAEGLLGESGARAGGMSSLVLLFELEQVGALRPKQVAELLSLTTGGATKLVDRLERQGTVTRTGAQAGDQRAVTVRITDEGRAIVAAARVGLVERLDDISATVAEMHAVLVQYAANTDAP